MGFPRIKHAYLYLVLAAITFLGTAVEARACGATGVCGDSSSSFTGHVGTETITLSWSTDDEDASIAYYRLRRYDCTEPGDCTTTVAIIPRTGVCGVTREYTYTDDPPAPATYWTYTLEVWRLDGTRACAIDAVPD